MNQLFTLSGCVKRDPAIQEWMERQPGDLGGIASKWFEVMRQCGQDVQETLHDDQPTACVSNVPFAYVAVYKAHLNIGFFRGAELPDPSRILQGTGKRMRHVKIRLDEPVDASALTTLIHSAYKDIKERANGT